MLTDVPVGQSMFGASQPNCGHCLPPSFWGKLFLLVCLDCDWFSWLPWLRLLPAHYSQEPGWCGKQHEQPTRMPSTKEWKFEILHLLIISKLQFVESWDAFKTDWV